MSNSITISAPTYIHAIVGKKGNVSKASQKAADTLNGVSGATLLAVSQSKGSLQKTAQQAIAKLVPSLSSMLSADSVANWGELLVMLANHYGLENLNRDKSSVHYMAGKAGVIKYVQLCSDAANLAVIKAEGEKARDKAEALKAELEVTREAINRLHKAHEAARITADTLKAAYDLETAALNEAAALAEALETSGLNAEAADTVTADTADTAEAEFSTAY